MNIPELLCGTKDKDKPNERVKTKVAVSLFVVLPCEIPINLIEAVSVSPPCAGLAQTVTFATLYPSPSLGMSETIMVPSFKSLYSNLISQSAGTSWEIN